MPLYGAIHKLRRQKTTFDDIDRGTDFINDDVVSNQKILKFYVINSFEI